MPSVRTIAREAGVSIATVSRVLNSHPGVTPESRDAVLRAANEVGYAPKVGRRLAATGIALGYAGPPSLDSPYDHALIAGIGLAVDDTAGDDRFGDDLTILNLRRLIRPGETPSQMMLRKGVKGVILRTTDEGRTLCERFAAEGFPHVVVGMRFPEGSPVSRIETDSRPASEQAVAHLIELGHERIAVSVNRHPDTDHADRIAGWEDAHEAAGLPADPALILRDWADYDAGIRLLNRLLSMPADERPTAVYTADPLPTIGLLLACRRRGLDVPGDLSVVGFDDSNVRQVTWPRPTLVHQDATAIGEAAALLLGERLTPEGRTRPGECRLAPIDFKAGETTGPPR